METNNTFSSSVSSLLNRWGVGGGPTTSNPTTPTTAASGGGAKASTPPPKKATPTPAPKNPASLSVTNVKPKAYDANILKNISDQYDKTYQSYWQSLEDSQKTDYGKDTITIHGGKDPGVKVPVALVKEIVQSAKRNGYDPYMALAQVSQESSFGTDTGQYTRYNQYGERLPSQPRTAIVQGLNLDEPYRPKEVAHYLSDAGVPGIKATKDRVEGYRYKITDEKKVNDYLNAHPEIVQKYQKHLSDRTKVPQAYNAYDEAWKRDKTGLKNYNANPQYSKNVVKYAQQFRNLKEIKELVDNG